VKSEAIDILKIYAEWDIPKWNAWLTERARLGDVAGLADARRRLQMGMTNLVEQKLNTDKVVETFFRMQRSIEKTIEQIKLGQGPERKIQRLELERFLRKTGY
jgi:hypothetical protein